MDSIDIEENELVLWIFINIIDIYLYFYVMCWDFDLWIIGIGIVSWKLSKSEMLWYIDL